MNKTDTLRLPMRLLRYLLPAALLAVLLVSIGAGVRLGLSLGEPFPGIAMMWRKEFKMYTVSYATPPHWSGLAAGLEIGDRILCIDGYQPNPEAVIYGVGPRYEDIECPNGVKKYIDVFRERFSGPDPAVDLLVDRDGAIMTIRHVPLVTFSFRRLLDVFLPSFLLSVALLAVGLIVYRAAPSRELNLVFACFTALVAELIAVETFPVIFSERLETMWIPTLFLIVPWVPFLGAVFFHLMGLLTDQEPLLRFHRRLRRPYYVLSFLTVLLGIFTYTFDASETTLTIPFDWLFLQLFAGSSVFAGLYGLFSLGWTFFKSDSRRVRHQARLILGGVLVTGLAVGPYIAFFLTDAVGSHYINHMPYLGLVFVAVVAYAILRYQLFASRTVILKVLLVVIFCVVAANLVYLLMGQQTPFLPVLATAIVVGLGLEARRGPTAFFNRLLRRETLDYRTVARFNRQVGELQEIESLLAEVRRFFRENLDVAHLDVWALDEKRRVVEHFRGGNLVTSRAIPPALTRHLRDVPGAVRMGSPQATEYRALLDEDAPAVSVWVPLVERGQVVGILGLGPRWTGEVYDDRDLELIEILARQMALSILNTRQMVRLRSASERIAQAAESERRKIARELHDTILQFLLVLTYGLDDLREQQPETADEIERWQERISVESRRLRELLNHLRAPELLVERGLIRSLADWRERAAQDTDVAIEADLAPAVEQALDVETQVALYRIFREAVNNALRHAQAERILLRLWREDERVRFAIEDDGQGFDVDRALQIGSKGYSSLADMRSHAEGVDGVLRVSSAPGEGTVIGGWVPAASDQEMGRR